MQAAEEQHAGIDDGRFGDGQGIGDEADQERQGGEGQHDSGARRPRRPAEDFR